MKKKKQEDNLDALLKKSKDKKNALKKLINELNKNDNHKPKSN
ncbi:hypothetical protein [Marixanthomonas ophiurae]|nr:hypothetical protein [Marixanthomonas ophiurae]